MKCLEVRWQATAPSREEKPAQADKGGVAEKTGEPKGLAPGVLVEIFAGSATLSATAKRMGYRHLAIVRNG